MPIAFRYQVPDESLLNSPTLTFETYLLLLGVTLAISSPVVKFTVQNCYLSYILNLPYA